MKVNLLFLILLFFMFLSCTKSKTDYEAEIDQEVPVYSEFEEAAVLQTESHKISVEALNGTFYKGYNDIRLKVYDKISNEKVKGAVVSFTPIRIGENEQLSSCPHLQEMVYNSGDDFLEGYVVFTERSDDNGKWAFEINLTVDGTISKARQDVIVREQQNKNLNMTSFLGRDEREYIIALIAPQSPKVGENTLVAGIYSQENYEIEQEYGEATFPIYQEAQGYTLRLDPRMPEPSMGNHSSPNNQDLTQKEDGTYEGRVNYTMTGNWTLNFIMLNEQGKVLKGTVVPDDFTPGVEGKKSELHLDVLF
ncbi:hypothetical protein ORI89_08930 [Sphingobacterium sp. UT-1RO-CII-1]|uniref:hypothetical protein n=1 Tax=Sphingobacterium sp. UT-1RO-CII-1 TaxID=2995225 RepID=UPI00227C4065|nr:hypothetical protein [Sphingobacterium sp. UT-1RO-CII-1]MCY4779775.1 hypothetical protein [Sphingobacterium sp. UT-1RO-CII-1]